MSILPPYVEKASSNIQFKLTYDYLFSVPAWYMYEYLLTLHAEVDVIWKSKFSLTAILFLINRYAFMLTWSFILLFDFVFATSIQVGHPVPEI